MVVCCDLCNGCCFNVEDYFATGRSFEYGPDICSLNREYFGFDRDVLKAWALGARGTMIGRPFLYGLGAMGEAGITKCLELIHNELDITMAFTGHRDIHNVTKDILYPGTFLNTKTQ